MNTKVLVLIGGSAKQRKTICNFLYGYLMQANDVTSKFEISDKGELLVYAKYLDESGRHIGGMGILDIESKEPAFCAYASNKIWPHIKKYEIGDPIKELMFRVFDIDYGTCYDEEKFVSNPTGYNHESFWFMHKINTDKGRELTGVMFFKELKGIFERINDKCLLELCKKRILEDSPEIAVVTDVSSMHEIEEIKSVAETRVIMVKSPPPSEELVYGDWSSLLPGEVDYVVDFDKDDALGGVLEKCVQWGFIKATL